jgi:hypothetical protein
MNKIKVLSGLLAVSLAFSLNGCGDEDSSPSVQNPPENTTLEARELSSYASHQKQYYGECEYSDGSATPIMVDVDDPYSDYAVFIHYLDPRGDHNVFNAYNNNGYVEYTEYDSGGTLNPDTEWKFNISDDGTYYTGTQDEGDYLFECDITLVLDAQTKEDLKNISN